MWDSRPGTRVRDDIGLPQVRRRCPLQEVNGTGLGLGKEKGTFIDVELKIQVTKERKKYQDSGYYVEI